MMEMMESVPQHRLMPPGKVSQDRNDESPV